MKNFRDHVRLSVAMRMAVGILPKVSSSLEGKILIAHPVVEDKRFTKTVLFVETDTGDGITAVILNRPLNTMLKAFGANFENLSVSDAPVYYGGEDGAKTVILTAWAFDKQKRTFEIYYTLDGQEADKLLQAGKQVQLRAFLGFCKFGNEIYSDIEKGLWIVAEAKSLFGLKAHEEAIWQTLLLQTSPDALIYH